MDAFHPGEIFWVLVFTVPVLAVLLILCTDCQDSELDTPPEEDHTCKPSTNAQTENFWLVRPPLSDCAETRLTSSSFSAVQSQTEFQRCPLYSHSYQPTSAIKAEEDTDSVPSYENQGPACITDDDDTDGNYIPSYIEVLPEAPRTDQDNGYRGSSDSIVEQYENVLETRQSPGEYVNVLEPEATIRDHFAGVSDQESEDDTPDYENVCPGL